MDSKSFRFQVIGRVVLIALALFLFSYLIFQKAFIVTIALVLLLAILLIRSLILFVSKSHQDITSVLKSIEYDDADSKFHMAYRDPELEQLNKEIDRILERFHRIREEKEADASYLRNIVQHVGIGLITFDRSGKIQICNTTAKKLLKVAELHHVDDLMETSPLLVESFNKLKTGGRDLVKIEKNGEIIQLSMYAIELTLKDKEFKLVSIQNIQSELEEKEMEAWQNLVRVLTHEIMNSVTPISSLATTVEQELDGQLKNGREVNTVTNEEIEDLYLAVSTIHKRSEGLIRFVSDFRNLTHIPTPKFQEVQVKPLIEQTLRLLKHEFKDHDVKIIQEIQPKTLSIIADPELIEQVLINLLKNACQSFEEESKNRQIHIHSYSDHRGSVYINVADNGQGIDEEALGKIFIPFFTTKKKGSGIGLSLSRQIMRQHKGTINVKSTVDEGTEFSLKF